LNKLAWITATAWSCLLLAGLAACSSAPPPRQPAMIERAGTLEQQGYAMMRDGNPNAASNLFEQELRLQQSLDNLPGIATAAINLSTAYHLLGNDEPALRLLDDIGSDAQIPYPAELRATALFRRAVILQDAGRTGEAVSALDAAENLCSGSCSLVAGIRNMRARMALSKGDYPAALDLAKAAANAAGDQKSELANAQRVSAAAEFALGHQERALQQYHAALEIDKQLGLGGRIADDLDGVARTLAQLGRKDEATGYARRAAAAHAAINSGSGNARLHN
jgi:tetratricopeptide (TPR) repeat protein